jgi:N-formylglutamate amidohydrolase
MEHDKNMVGGHLPSAPDELNPPFSVVAPREQTAPFVVCSPHSGRHYTQAFLSQSRLDPLSLRRSEDYCVDELYACAVDLGAPLLHAHFPRAYLDANREPYELDPDLFDDVLPDYANTQSVRVIGGLGTIARIVSDGEEIYKQPLKLADALKRIENLYTPFHDTLKQLIEETRRKFGYAILLDCHSMPSAQLQSSGSARPEFVLGDRFGHSCDPKLTRFMRDTISASGYDVQLNRPYAGGFITEHYGRPHRGIHAVQIEMNRGLYMDEINIRPNRGFERLRANLRTIVGRTFDEVPLLLEKRLAAE